MFVGCVFTLYVICLRNLPAYCGSELGFVQRFCSDSILERYSVAAVSQDFAVFDIFYAYTSMIDARWMITSMLQCIP